VTIDAVTRSANVARATLYRHFPSANDLMAAAFQSLLHPAPMPPEDGCMRERLIAVVDGWAQSIAEVPTMLTAMTWMASGPDAGAYSDVRDGDSDAVGSLRVRIIQLYSAPFDAIFDSPGAIEELDVPDRMQAIALLIGPLILGRMSTVDDFDYRACAEAAVDGFLATHSRKARGITSTSSESAGA
jgi:AcrR family transcriptional regulator